MKVKDLIAALLAMDQEADVILQKDAEGNGCSPLSDADCFAVYVDDNAYSGQVYSLMWNHQEAGFSREEWAEIKKRPRCVVLYPIN